MNKKTHSWLVTTEMGCTLKTLNKYVLLLNVKHVAVPGICPQGTSVRRKVENTYE